MLWLPALLLFFAEDGTGESIDTALQRFAKVFAVVEENTADPVNTAQLVFEGAIPGMLRRLDPHSVFLDPGQFDQLKEMEKSTRKGFGSVVSLLPGRVIVLQTLPGTPSARSGMSPGDEIVGINGIRLDLLQVEQLVQLLGQARLDRVVVDVRRPGNARLIQLTLTPAEVDSPSVDRAFALKPGVGYVRVASFDVPTAKQFQEAVERLGGEKLEGLVIDLRDNPGGVLPAALDMASLFLQPGQKILSVKGRAVQGSDAEVPATAKPYAFPVAILINEKSASASEIVAGALQDHKRAVVVGVPSFGKGLVQSVFPLSQNTALALTTAFYHTPSGRNIQKPLQGQLEKTTEGATGGVMPNETVFDETPERLKIFLDASGAFTMFATEFLRGKTIDEGFVATNELLDQFQSALSQRNVQPSLGEWSRSREWIRSRLLQEIFNQSLGVAKGDEVEMARDPVVRAALRLLGR